MKKTDVIQIALVIIGILIITKTFNSFILQIGLYTRPNSDFDTNSFFIFTFIIAMIFVIIIGTWVIRNSNYLSKKIIKEELDQLESINISNSELLTNLIIILSLFFLITGFPSVIGSLIFLTTSFFINYTGLNEVIIGYILKIVQYLFLILLFIKAKYISNWIYIKLVK
jgi:hypothetical protein